MSMMARIFKPGTGKRHERFTSAYVNGTAVYRGDLVCWDITAPASQGASGVVNGETLGANDFVYVILPPAAAAAAQGLAAGCVRGRTFNDQTSNATAIPDDSLVHIQTWGVCDLAWVTSTDTAAGDLLLTGATTGEWTRALATTINGTDSTQSIGALAGFALTADSTDHIRGTATAEERATIWVRCDG